MPTHLYIVRAVVPEASKREAFDRWYSKEHLPDAAKSFGAQKAWRFWSASDPMVHQAMYQFPDRATLDSATTGEHGKRLVADFDRDWADVKRSREILVLAEEYGGS